ncbi:MAG: PssE/Cps14G family polysaccharide biosynthesis glycosyltransferase [Bacillota bacterium]
MTVGTQRFQFDRLFQELDNLVEQKIITEPVIAQAGYSNYKPKHFSSSILVSAEEMDQHIEDSELIITHSGTSSIIKCLKMDKKVIVVPRQKKYGEHVDDHQLEIAQLFAQKGLIEPVYDIKDLKIAIEVVNEKEYGEYEFDNSKLLGSISDYLTELNNSLR